MTGSRPQMDEETLETRRYELARLERWLDKPMLVLAIVWLVLVVLELTIGLSSFMEGVGVAIWIAFILDFVLRLVIAPDRAGYLRANWLTARLRLSPKPARGRPRNWGVPLTES